MQRKGQKTKSLTRSRAVKNPDLIWQELSTVTKYLYGKILELPKGGDAIAATFPKNSEGGREFRKLYGRLRAAEKTFAQKRTGASDIKQLKTKLLHFEDRGECDENFYEMVIAQLRSKGHSKPDISPILEDFERLKVVSKLAGLWGSFLVEADDLDLVS